MSLNGTAVCGPGGVPSCLHLNKNKATTVKGPDRILVILEWLQEHIDDMKPTHICWEDYAFAAKNQRGNFDKAELGGAVKLLALSQGIPLIAVPPTTLKKYVTGWGNAKKEHMMETIEERWGYHFDDDNEADAFALMKYGYEWLKENALDSNDMSGKVQYYQVTDRCERLQISV